jgi:8-oxo-dGTP diphosphatase
VQSTLTSHAGTRPALFQVSTDIVIFAVRRARLEVLLVRRDPRTAGASWALPGGCPGVGEPLDECAQRALRVQTGLKDVYLEQLYTFGRPDRHPEARVVSVAYYALVSGDRLQAVEPLSRSTWHAAGDLPDLHLDHEEIILVARERLEAKLEYSTIAFQLMPEYFTLSELQQVYETICSRPIDKRNFRKRVLAMAHVEATDRKRCNGSHRPARLYRYTSRDAIHYLK